MAETGCCQQKPNPELYTSVELTITSKHACCGATAARFCKPIQDRRVPSTTTVSKGSIYAALHHQDPPTLRVLNGNSSTAGDSGGGLLPSIVDVRTLHTPSRLDPGPVNHRATPNSDDTSDPDAASSNMSFDAGIGSTSQVASNPLVPTVDIRVQL